MGVDNYIFWADIGSGFEEPSGTGPPRIPRSNPGHEPTNSPTGHLGHQFFS